MSFRPYGQDTMYPQASYSLEEEWGGWTEKKWVESGELLS